MPRKAQPAPKTKAPDVVKTSPAEAIQEQQLVAQHQLLLAKLDERIGLDIPYDFDVYIDRARDAVAVVSERLFVIGRVCLAIKEHEPHGRFQDALDRIGVAPRFAQKCMASAVKFLGSDQRKLVAGRLASTKLLELLSEDDESLDVLGDGGTLAGHTLDDIERMSVRELKESLRKEREQKQQAIAEAEGDLDAKDKKIRELRRQITRMEKGELADKVKPMLEEASLRFVSAVQSIVEFKQALEAITTLYSVAGEQIPKDVDELLEQHAGTMLSHAREIGELAGI